VKIKLICFIFYILIFINDGLTQDIENHYTESDSIQIKDKTKIGLKVKIGIKLPEYLYGSATGISSGFAITVPLTEIWNIQPEFNYWQSSTNFPLAKE
jgi:hypothetical protein